MTSSAFIFSWTCSTRLAPVITLLTLGLERSPGERELGRGASDLVGNGLEFSDLGVGVVVGQMLAEPLDVLRPAALRDAVEVLAGQQA